jgi:hypothetical protein
VTAAEPLVELDYAVVVDAAALAEVALIEDPTAVRLLIAGVVGPVRLIDNSAALDTPALDTAALEAAMHIPLHTSAETEPPGTPAGTDRAVRTSQLERIG